MVTIGEILAVCSVALLWGITNPLLKKSGKGIEDVKAKGKLSKLFAEVKFLIGNWKFLIPFALNQFGSVLYFWALAHAEVSIISPLTNALTFVITSMMAQMLEKEYKTKNLTVGIMFVITGVTFCIRSKL